MDCRFIEIFYNVYKNSIRTISGLEQKLLRESNTYGRWYDFLREKSRTIRELYIQNEELYDVTIGELLRDPGQLDRELAEMFLTHIDFFWSEGYRDYGVVVPVLEVLIPFYEANGPKARLFDCFFFQGVAIMEQHRFTEAIEWFDRAIGLYPDIRDCGENYRQYRIMCAYYHRLVAYRWKEHMDQGQLYEYFSQALDIWTRQVPDGFLTEKKISAIASILRMVAGYAVNDLLDKGEEILPALEQVAEDEYLLQKDSGGVECAAYVIYHKLCWKRGGMDTEEYRQCILDKYRQESGAFADGYHYGVWDFTALFDDELPDDEFDRHHLFYMNESYSYVNYLLPELLEHTEDQELKERVINETYRYYSKMNFISGDSMVDLLIERNLKVVLQHCTDMEMISRFIENAFVHRQICTAIHSGMVSRLAVLVVEHLVDYHPKELVGLFGTSSVGEVTAKREQFVEYIRMAGMCHDLGKMTCSDVINLQARRIQDAEFAVIKTHPSHGARILCSSPALCVFQDIAEGHHKMYNGKGGYPADFDNTSSPYRLLIDVITICDSVDAATDSLGRNYATAKTFRTVLGELREGGGTRYNGRLVSMIADDEVLVGKMETLVDKDRAMVQFEVYKKFVRPDVEFVPEDEKYIRPCSDEDIAGICAFSGKSEEEQREICRRGAKAGYLLLDGHGTIFGAVFAEAMDAENADILQIVVDPKHRRTGCGTMLIEHLVDIAYSKGCRRIYMQKITEGHYDKFGWRNNFSACDREGYLVRNL